MPDVCTLLSAADIAGIIGKDPGVGTPGDGVCIYDSVKLNLGIAPADLYETALDSAKSDDQVAGIKDIAGIGDAAVYVTQKDDANAVLAKQGRYDEALALFERLLSLRNDLGLISEEYDPERKQLVGNFPQAFTHMTLVETAFTLSDAASAR